MAAAKLRELIRVGGDAIKGPWDGDEAITLMADLDAGATGAMTGGVIRLASRRSCARIPRAIVRARRPLTR